MEVIMDSLLLLFSRSSLIFSAACFYLLVMLSPLSAQENKTAESRSSVSTPIYVVVDSIHNAYSAAIANLNPLAYDPHSEVLGFVHRGHSSYGSGEQLWYNYSTDKGCTWQRVGPIRNSGSARYPSMVISNPEMGDIDKTKALFTWSELPYPYSSGYGGDIPVGGGNFVSSIIPGNYNFTSASWGSDSTPYMFWVNESSDSTLVWRTSNFNDVTARRLNTDLFSGGMLLLGGAGIGSLQHIGVIGRLDSDAEWFPGLFTSTDYGERWDNGSIVDFRTIPLLSSYDMLLDYLPDIYSTRIEGDLNIDTHGRAHIVTALTDTNTTPWKHSVVDIYQTETGWNASIIADLTGDPYQLYKGGPGVDQMGYCVYLAFDTTRQAMAVQWVDKGVGGYADVYITWKHLEDTEWMVPYNLTESPQHNTQSHLAPVLAGSNRQFTAFSMYAYQKGVDGPVSDPTATTNIYVAKIWLPGFCGYGYTVKVLTPKGGEVLKIGSTYDITFDAWGADAVGIEYSTNGGYSWAPIGYSQNCESYSWVVPNTPSNACKVKVYHGDVSGISQNYFTITDALDVDENNETVTSYQLYQNYPNPFNPSTRIKFQLPESGQVSLKVYDIIGNEVSVLVNGFRNSGAYETEFDASLLSSGIYFIHFRSGGFTDIKKMVVVK
jgi:hypothetical protein